MSVFGVVGVELVYRFGGALHAIERSLHHAILAFEFHFLVGQLLVEGLDPVLFARNPAVQPARFEGEDSTGLHPCARQAIHFQGEARINDTILIGIVTEELGNRAYVILKGPIKCFLVYFQIAAKA